MRRNSYRVSGGPPNSPEPEETIKIVPVSTAKAARRFCGPENDPPGVSVRHGKTSVPESADDFRCLSTRGRPLP